MRIHYLFLALVMVLGSCGGESTPPGSDVTIGVMPKLIGIDYFNAC